MLETKLDPVRQFVFCDLIPEPASSNLTPKKTVSCSRSFRTSPGSQNNCSSTYLASKSSATTTTRTTNRRHLCLRFSSSRTARSNSACKAAFSAASRSASKARKRKPRCRKRWAGWVENFLIPGLLFYMTIEMPMFNKKYIFKCLIFHCHVSFRGVIDKSILR